MNHAPSDIRRAARFLRALESRSASTRRKCAGHAALLDRAAAHLDTLLRQESAMRDLNTLIPLVVDDLTKTRAALAAATETASAKDATIADLTARLATAQAAAASPENLAALDALEPEPVVVPTPDAPPAA